MLRDLCLTGIAALSIAAVSTAQGPTKTKRLEAFVPGEVLVCPMPGEAASAANGVSAVGLRIVERDALSGVLRVAVPVGREETWVELLPILNAVESAERNGTGQGGLAPDDTHYGAQWHLRNTGAFGGAAGRPGRDNDHGHGRINAYRSLVAVALVGSDDADLRSVDLSSVRIARADGVGGEVAPSAGPPGPRFADLVTPGAANGCHRRGPDGIADLSIEFRSEDIARELKLDGLSVGATIELVLRGSLSDGRRFVATDSIALVPLGPGPTPAPLPPPPRSRSQTERRG